MGRTLLYHAALVVLVCFLRVQVEVQGKQVTVRATDARIAFSWNWYQPQQFDRVPAVDGFTAGGPNSSLCALGDVSRLSRYEGDLFNFTFHGTSASLVMASRPDHAPFSVAYDGAAYAGDTYSAAIACGAAWTSPVSPAREHTITCTNHPAAAGGARPFLQLLSIVYDDGSGEDPAGGGESSLTSASRTATPSPSATAKVTSSLKTTTAPRTGTKTSASGSTSSSTARPSHSGGTPTASSKVDQTSASATPNGPGGGDGDNDGGGNTADTESLQTDPRPTPTTPSNGAPNEGRPQRNARFSTAAAAGVAVTSGLSCLALAWGLWACRKRFRARRKRRMIMVVRSARSAESFAAMLSERGGLDGASVERSGSGSSSFGCAARAQRSAAATV